MPNLVQPERKSNIAFRASVTLDLLNAMYFTSLAGQLEGVGEWPMRERARMNPSLRDELDLLFNYPRGQAGVMGALNDLLCAHPEAWDSVDALLELVRRLPAEGSAEPDSPGIQGLAVYALRWPCESRFDPPPDVSLRDAVAMGMDDAFDVSGASGNPKATFLRIFDDPEGLRARMLRLIQRFYDEHYRPDERRRRVTMARAITVHGREDARDAVALARRLTGRSVSCLEGVCADDEYTRYVFLPSIDMGPYTSCCALPGVHMLYYPCDLSPDDDADHGDEDGRAHRLALIYKALGDEQRLRILRLLRGGELYAQEIVERTGLHQSVVSRHVSFLVAVGLVTARRQNNMKFYALATGIGDELRGAIDALLPPA